MHGLIKILGLNQLMRTGGELNAQAKKEEEAEREYYYNKTTSSLVAGGINNEK